MLRIVPECPICHQPMAVSYKKTTTVAVNNLEEEYWEWEEHSCDRCGYRTSSQPAIFSSAIMNQPRKVSVTWV